MSIRSVTGFYFTVSCFYFLLSARSSQIPVPLSGYKETIDVFKTQRCPKTESEWRAASNRLNCSIDNDPPVNQYHCLPTPKKDMLVEFCYDEYSKITEHGNCLELGGKGFLNYVNCTGFTEGCPNKDYKSEEIFKYPVCLEIDVEKGCFFAEEDCKVKSSFTTMTTESTTRSGDTLPLENIVVPVAILLCLISALILYLKKRQHRNFPRLESESREETHSTDTSGSCNSGHYFKTNTKILDDQKKHPDDHRNLLTKHNMENGILSITINDRVSTFGEKTTITGNVNRNFQIQGLEWQKSVSKCGTNFKTISIYDSKYMGSSVDPSQPCLVINYTEDNDAVIYRLVGYLADEHITSNDVEVSVLGGIPHPKLKKEYIGYEDNELTMYGDLNSIPPRSNVKWLYCKDKFGEFTEIKIEENGFQEFFDDKHAELVIKVAKLADSGYYKMVVSNILGEGISDPAFLSIKEDIKRTSKSLSFPPVLPIQRKCTNTQDNIQWDQTALPNAFIHLTLNIPDIDCVSHISVSVNDTLWISDDKGSLLHIDMRGTILSHACVDISGARICHTVTKTNELLYTNENQRKIYKISNTGKFTEFPFFPNENEGWKPTCIYSSHIDESIRVGQIKESEAKIVRHNKIGVVENEIQGTIMGQVIFQHPCEITENQEGDLCVIDKKACTVVGFNKKGDYIFTYPCPVAGGNSSSFHPSGICIDRFGNILVSNYCSNEIEIIDKKGNFLKCLSFTLDKSPLNNPRALYSDGKGKLFIGQSGQNASAKVKIYNYGQIYSSD